MLNRQNKYFCQLLNVHCAGGVKQTEMCTAEQFVPEPSTSENAVANGKMKKCISSQVLITFQQN
jgi:hypothetical protein